MNRIITLPKLEERVNQLMECLPDEEWELFGQIDEQGFFEYSLCHDNLAQTNVMVKILQCFTKAPNATHEQKVLGDTLLKLRGELELLLNQMKLRESRIKYLEQVLLEAKIRF